MIGGARRALCGLICALAVAATTVDSDSSVAKDRVWFSPNPGTTDLQRMFARPEEWPRARALMSVFNFTQQSTDETADPLVGPNSYDALARAGVFRQLAQWGKKISIGVGVVKDFYCTPDGSGAATVLQKTLHAIDAVTAAGGKVQYLSMDEPWVSGRSKQCDGPALDRTADRVAVYMSAVGRVHPEIRIGLIEAYPFSSAEQIESMLSLLQDRGTPPAFLHMDVDWHLSGGAAFTRDMSRLAAAAHARDIPFGIIITGYNGDADALFADDAYGIARLIGQTFGHWDAMPDHIMFDSWVVSRTGLNITPSNLPEDRAYTQTRMMLDIYRYLRGLTTTAAPR